MTSEATETPQRPSRKAKKSLLKRPAFWVPVGIVLAVLVVLGVIAALLVPRALTAKDALEAAVPLASQAKNEILGGDSDAANAAATELTALAEEARSATNDGLWTSFEWVPVLGENMRAVRVVSEAVHTLSTQVLEPATSISISALTPVDGAIDTDALTAMVPVVDSAADAAARVTADLATLETGSLIGQLQYGVTQLGDAVAEISALAEPAQTVLQVLPAALGAEGPRNYLLIFQNNAEVRTTGGNPAAIALITADHGRVEMTQQASSSDFNNNRDVPIIPLNPETQAIYGDRVGTWMQDITFTPDFAESSDLMRAFWAESFGTNVDAVVSFDPVALAYLLEATGPVTLETGDVLTPENAVPLLLNEVYFRYPKNQEQDAFFAAAAQSIFGAVTGGGADVRSLVDALAKSVDEGRLMFSSFNEAEMALIEGTTIAGPLPANNDSASVVGVFFNDLTVGKMDYYLHAEVDGSSTQCEVTGAGPASFSATVHMSNPIDAALRDSMPMYIKANAYGYHGAIHTDVLFYGPVGTKVSAVEIDGEIVGIGDRYDGEYREMTHMGRPVLQVPILLRMQTDATLTVTFTAGDGQSAADFGPFDVRTTPLPHTTPVTVARPGCE